MTKMIFEQAIQHFKENGFYLVVHPVVIHHMLKDFEDYDVVRHAFYIKPAGEDFVHVAVIEYENGIAQGSRPAVVHVNYALQIRYSCAGDDLLYGLKIKYKNGGSPNPSDDIAAINGLVKDIKESTPEEGVIYPSVRNHPHYIRKRFRHGRRKAKIRAFLVMLKDLWKSFRFWT